MERALIAMGSNLASWAGTPVETLVRAREALGELGNVVRASSLYATDPVGYDDQPRFVNAVVMVETELAPLDVLDALLQIEQEFGRDRSHGIANGPRTLDLDLLLMGDAVLDEARLTLPHPRLGERMFVLVPLGEIAAKAVEPVSGQTVGTLLRQLEARVPRAGLDPIADARWTKIPEE